MATLWGGGSPTRSAEASLARETAWTGGWFPDPWRFVRCGWVPEERRLFLFQELSASRKTPAETGTMAAEALTLIKSV